MRSLQIGGRENYVDNVIKMDTIGAYLSILQFSLYYSPVNMIVWVNQPKDHGCSELLMFSDINASHRCNLV